MKQQGACRRWHSFDKYLIVVYLAITVHSAGSHCAGAEAPKSPAAALRLRGFMVDEPRTPRSAEYYHRLIDFCADWGFNARIFRVTDDQGVAIRLESHPELLTHKNAFTTPQIRELVKHARDRGIELILSLLRAWNLEAPSRGMSEPMIRPGIPVYVLNISGHSDSTRVIWFNARAKVFCTVIPTVLESEKSSLGGRNDLVKT